MEEVRGALGGEEPCLKNDRYSPDQVRPSAKIWCRTWLRHVEPVFILTGSVLSVAMGELVTAGADLRLERGKQSAS